MQTRDGVTEASDAAAIKRRGGAIKRRGGDSDAAAASLVTVFFSGLNYSSFPFESLTVMDVDEIDKISVPCETITDVETG
ncbi:hypothetical protein LINGRAHAP2_LOCUS32107 [Linum grandiflorum]